MAQVGDSSHARTLICTTASSSSAGRQPAPHLAADLLHDEGEGRGVGVVRDGGATCLVHTVLEHGHRQAGLARHLPQGRSMAASDTGGAAAWHEALHPDQQGQVCDHTVRLIAKLVCCCLRDAYPPKGNMQHMPPCVPCTAPPACHPPCPGTPWKWTACPGPPAWQRSA